MGIHDSSVDWILPGVRNQSWVLTWETLPRAFNQMVVDGNSLLSGLFPRISWWDFMLFYAAPSFGIKTADPSLQCVLSAMGHVSSTALMHGACNKTSISE